MCSIVDGHATSRPHAAALVGTEDEIVITWSEFSQRIHLYTQYLSQLDIKEGDIIVTTLPFSLPHVLLLFGAWSVGAIVAPLDQRLKAEELITTFSQLRPVAWIYERTSTAVDYGLVIAQVQQRLKESGFIRHWIDEDTLHRQAMDATHVVPSMMRHVGREESVCLLISTTGSTGKPKAAMLTHRNIITNNILESVCYCATWCSLATEPENLRTLVNLPPSHVGGLCEQLCTTLYAGGTGVLMRRFDARNTLYCVQRWKVSFLGQIPAMFEMLWGVKDFFSFDCSSLRYVQYGGQAGTAEFISRLAQLAPYYGSQYGLTECAGALIVSPLFTRDTPVDIAALVVGHCMPSLSPLTIRSPMTDDGYAGTVLPEGTVGEICFAGPQVFAGYYGNESATSLSVSKDGICYTGDLGIYRKENGLQFAGRAKWRIKPKGFQVFPGEVEEFFISALPDDIAAIACVGAPHRVWGDAVAVFVQQAPSSRLTPQELEARIHKAAQRIASYKRPCLVMFEEIPLSRVNKTDYIVLQQRAREHVEELRKSGKWDQLPARL